jgi:hypothetical protein
MNVDFNRETRKPLEIIKKKSLRLKFVSNPNFTINLSILLFQSFKELFEKW